MSAAHIKQEASPELGAYIYLVYIAHKSLHMFDTAAVGHVLHANAPSFA